jgi:hypothetical protein
MSRGGKLLVDSVVNAFDRASQAQYRLQELIERVEEAILQDKETIRAACPLEGGENAMARALLHYLQLEQRAVSPGWAGVALEQAIAVIDVKRLARTIWPELKRRASQGRGSAARS